MEKRKIICVVAILFVLILTMCKFNINKVNNKVLEEIKQDTKVNKKQFAMFIKENGEYKEYTSSDTFPEGYVIDKNMSKCYDAEDQEIEGITFTGNSNNITVTSGKTAYCYLYFKEPTGGNQILDNLPADSGLSASTLGDMRRYQGTNVKNYICINDTGAKCNSGTDEMYRIIGIVDSGTDEGQIKVIKEKSYGSTYKWNNNNLASQCGGTTCSWPNNDLAKTLNSTFLNSLPKKVQDKIVSRQWYYGDIGMDYASISAEEMYQIESGQTNTTYYDIATNELITNQKWQKTSTQLKIGLMYIHDYAYAANSHAMCCRSNYSSCRSSWIIMKQNGESGTEWVMTRLGRSAQVVIGWVIEEDARLYLAHLTSTFYVRPVFYLSSDVKIQEGGTGEVSNPYILDLN